MSEIYKNTLMHPYTFTGAGIVNIAKFCIDYLTQIASLASNFIQKYTPGLHHTPEIKNIILCFV